MKTKHFSNFSKFNHQIPLVNRLFLLLTSSQHLGNHYALFTVSVLNRVEVRFVVAIRANRASSLRELIAVVGADIGLPALHVVVSLEGISMADLLLLLEGVLVLRLHGRSVLAADADIF